MKQFGKYLKVILLLKVGIIIDQQQQQDEPTTTGGDNKSTINDLLWDKILDEESGSYYYQNKETFETIRSQKLCHKNQMIMKIFI